MNLFKSHENPNYRLRIVNIFWHKRPFHNRSTSPDKNHLILGAKCVTAFDK